MKDYYELLCKNMSKCRMINTKFWNDNYIVNLLPDEKLLFLYFLTSPLTNISGVYECPIKMMAVHTGFDRENLEIMLARFEGKIHYIEGWVYIRNFVKHQSSESASVKRGIEIEMENVPNSIKERIEEIENVYGEKHGGLRLFDIKKETAEEKEAKRKVREKAEKNEEAITRIMTLYNKKINPRSSLTKKAKDKLKIRLKEFTEEQIMDGIVKFSNNDWRMSHNKSQGTEWFFRSEGQVQKWIELESEEVKKVVNI